MAIREAVTRAQEALKSERAEDVRTAHQELAEAAQAIADALYSGAMEGADEIAEEMYDDELADEAF